MESKSNLLDYGIIFVCRAVRSFFAGVFALILIENLLSKGLSFADVGSLQLYILAGCVLAAKIITRLAKTLGVVNMLVVASLSKCAATFAFAHAKSNSALSTAAAFGCFAIYGDWFCPFLALERVVLAQLAKDPAKTEEKYKDKVSNLLVFHNALGCIVQAGGMLFAGVSLQHGFYVLSLPLKVIGETMLTQSAFSAFACLVLYAFLDRKKIQPDASDAETDLNSSGSPLASLVYCLEGTYVYIFSQSYFIHLLRKKYNNIYIGIIPTLNIFIYCSIVGFIMFALLRRRINGVLLYSLTSIVPNVLVLLASFLSIYQDAFRILIQLAFLFGIAAYSQRPSLIRKLFPGPQKGSIDWLVMAGYLIGGVIGFMLQQRYDLADGLISIAGMSRLVVDAIVLSSYSKRRKEIGPFSNLMLEEMPEKVEQESQKLSCFEEI